MQEYEELPGGVNLPGFVKGNPLNNESYLEMCKEYFTEEEMERILNAHRQIVELIPHYNIAQIKHKFGEIRYYISYPLGTVDEATSRKANEIADSV